jgi:two-component system chemotaxis response regulator CheB
MEKKQILLVDDEPFILDMMVWYLAADADLYGIFRAGSAEEAMEIIDRERIFLVVADVNMPGMSGLDLLSAIRSRYPHIKVILMTGDKGAEVREGVRKSGCLHFLEKPLEMKELRRTITEEIRKKDEGFHGTLKNIQLNDLIQLCCQAAINTAIRVSKSEKEGMIFIRDGEIVHAVCADHVGENAFYEILCWKSGRFETLGEIFIPDVSISKNWHHLLMDAARRMDEEGGATCNVQHAEDEERNNKIRVLIADDSSMMCKVLTEILASDQDIEVVGTAKNGEDAIKKMEELMPDLITLDVNMPVMDGGTALKHIMIKKPCPVVMLSNVGEKSQTGAPDFLRLGAADFLHKPVRSKDMDIQRRQIIQRVKLAATAKMDNFRRMKDPKILPDKDHLFVGDQVCKSLIVINSGPGGYSELLDLVCSAKNDAQTCIVAFQTMPGESAVSLAEYLNPRTRLSVLPLQPNQQFSGGCCYVSGNDVEENAFDALINSLADSFFGEMIVVLLSGAAVGNTGNIRRIRAKGAKIIVQKLSSCMVSEPLENVVREQLADMEAATSEIAEIMRKIGTES